MISEVATLYVGVAFSSEMLMVGAQSNVFVDFSSIYCDIYSQSKCMADIDRIRILIVENEGLVGCDLASTLSHLGYDVCGICRTGEEALQSVDDLRPDIVLMDVHLSGTMDGIETARLMTERNSVAIVYLTACADQETVARARETHPYAYLLKPYNEDELRSTVEIAAARHRSERQRQRLEHSFAQTIQSLNDAVIAADLAGRVAFVNQAAEKILGCTADSVLGRSLADVYSIRQPGGESVPLLPPLDDQNQIASRSLILTDQHGQMIAINDHVTPVRDEHGGLSGVVILFRPEPSTLPRETTQSLVHSAAEGGSSHGAHTTALLADIVESISDPLVALDSHWRFTYANSSASKLLDRDKQILQGLNIWEVLPPSVHSSHYQSLAHAMLHRESVTREIFLEARHMWFEARAYPFATGLLLLFKDITSRKVEAERNSRMDRLESLGLLARGFAHDFNNLLTVLLGNLALAEMRFPSQPDKNVELQTAKQATLQAQSLVQQLLTFARGGAPIKRQVSLSDLAKTFFHHHPRVDRVNYLVEVQEDLPRVAADPNQIRRLLGNIIRNAEQAMPLGGEIIVRVEAADASTLFPHEMVSDSSGELAGITIEVRDTGDGILPDHLPHIFEPYFSTRKSLNATGLGLTVCESIAKSHGGSISVRSQKDQGTIVRFFLPLDGDVEEAESMALGKAFEPQPPAAARILVLEDDNLVRSLIMRNLSSQGYDVVGTIEGNETVQRFQESMQSGRHFDLLVLDLAIPNGMGGLRTMEKIRALDANVLAIVSSGYSDDPVMAQPSAYGFAAVLPKPYEPVELLRLVKNLLAARAPKRPA